MSDGTCMNCGEAGNWCRCDERHYDLEDLVRAMIESRYSLVDQTERCRRAVRVALDLVHTDGTAKLDEEARGFRLHPSHEIERMSEPSTADDVRQNWMQSLGASSELIAFVDQVFQRARTA